MRFGKNRVLLALNNLRITLRKREARGYFTPAGRAELLSLVGGSISTGVAITDYHLLHSFIVQRRPRRVLEFGSGRSTVVMAQALSEVHAKWPDQPPGHLYSFEEIPRYHENVKALLPDTLKRFVTPLCSPKRESYWQSEIWGFSYSELPPGPFELVFVDGPTEKRDGKKGACLDLLYLLERDRDSVLDVVVDGKLPSLEAYQSVLPQGMVCYDPVMDVGILAGVRGTMLSPRHPIEENAFEYLRMPGRRGDAWRLLGLRR